ncbi:MAG: hypothetical protein QMD92_06250 [bacterium]|nr:hypothetical protein [bacterium]
MWTKMLVFSGCLLGIGLTIGYAGEGNVGDKIRDRMRKRVQKR